jgi:hypothetical protein
MIEYSEILSWAHAQAILNTLESSEVAVHRQICREYSKKFHTPLHLVLQMDPHDVILAYYEDLLENFDKDEPKHMEYILDTIYTLEDPNYSTEKGNELQEFIDKAEQEEEERVAAGRPIHKAMKKQVTLKHDSEKPDPALPKRPTGGSINLSYLSKEEED